MTNNSALPPPGLETQLLHADQPNHEQDPTHPIAPSMSLSTTFRQPFPDSDLAKNADASLETPERPLMHVYSRYTQETNVRTEQVLSSLLGGYALTYGSGLSASLAVVSAVNPSVIALRRGYFGVHEVFKIYSRNRDVSFIDLDDEYPEIEGKLDSSSGLRQGGLLVWVETPLNPTGEARDLEYYTKRAHAKKGYIGVDSTFAPPPLQNPFNQGVDFVMHSATKYLGGHSDVLAGVTVTRDHQVFKSMWHDRCVYGNVLGSMESYLLLRSLRTVTLRVRRQSETAAKLVKWLHSLTKGQQAPEGTPASITDGRAIHRVYHSSLQPLTKADTELDQNPFTKIENRAFDPSQQMPGGHSPTFAIWLVKPDWGKYLPHYTLYFTPATSLGGVESLMEQRILSTPDEKPNLVRISTGLEDFDDLRSDIAQALLRTLEKHP
ncbi:cystathionine gamma-synthase [Malassezia psittaci]|uniref:Cystathionine gamma-synthase n=1 Tax=Malassezia psittaci TaxID=1821823 RepID=A0AAF0FB36_9BASI|nr:cystathionine gamma-synthase [Malassezia psittaci]